MSCCWAMDFQSWAKNDWKYKQFSHIPFGIFSMYPFLHSLKLFLYIDNCLYIAVEAFSKNSYKLFEKKFHRSFDANLEKCTTLHILPPILSIRLTALPSLTQPHIMYPKQHRNWYQCLQSKEHSLPSIEKHWLGSVLFSWL